MKVFFTLGLFALMLNQAHAQLKWHNAFTHSAEYSTSPRELINKGGEVYVAVDITHINEVDFSFSFDPIATKLSQLRFIHFDEFGQRLETINLTSQEEISPSIFSLRESFVSENTLTKLFMTKTWHYPNPNLALTDYRVGFVSYDYLTQQKKLYVDEHYLVDRIHSHGQNQAGGFYFYALKNSSVPIDFVFQQVNQNLELEFSIAIEQEILTTCYSAADDTHYFIAKEIHGAFSLNTISNTGAVNLVGYLPASLGIHQGALLHYSKEVFYSTGNINGTNFLVKFDASGNVLASHKTLYYQKIEKSLADDFFVIQQVGDLLGRKEYQFIQLNSSLEVVYTYFMGDEHGFPIELEVVEKEGGATAYVVGKTMDSTGFYTTHLTAFGASNQQKQTGSQQTNLKVIPNPLPSGLTSLQFELSATKEIDSISGIEIQLIDNRGIATRTKNFRQINASTIEITGIELNSGAYTIHIKSTSGVCLGTGKFIIE